MKRLILIFLLIGCASKLDPVNIPAEIIENETVDSVAVENVTVDTVEVENEIVVQPETSIETKISCGGPVGLKCLDAEWVDGIITAQFQNNLGEEILITALTDYKDEEPWHTITYCETNQALSLDVKVGEKFSIEIDCSDFDRLDQGFELEYNGIKGYFKLKS